MQNKTLDTDHLQLVKETLITLCHTSIKLYNDIIYEDTVLLKFVCQNETSHFQK